MKILESLFKLFFIDENADKKKRISEINDLIQGARKFLNELNDYVILDTETTGLGENDIIIQIAIIDLHENDLINTYVKS